MFYISAPLEHILSKAQISPYVLNRILIRRRRHRLGPLGPQYAVARRMSLASGTRVTHLQRRGRYICMAGQIRGARYGETNSREAWFMCPGVLPSQAVSQTPGRRLGEIVSIGPGHETFESLIVRQWFDPGPDWSGFDLQPVWHQYT